MARYKIMYKLVDVVNDSYELTECEFCKESYPVAYMNVVEGPLGERYLTCTECLRTLDMEDPANSISAEDVDTVLSTIKDELSRCWKQNIIGTEVLDEYGQGLKFAKELIERYAR